MPQQFTIQPIEANTKGKVKELRRTGNIPVSVQHKGQGTLHYQLETKPLDDFIRAHGQASMLELVVEGGARHQALVHDVQRDRLTKKLLQVTFQGVEIGDTVKVLIPIVFHGEPGSVRLKAATLQHAIEQVEVRCQPGDLPDHITVDVSNMTVNDTMRVSDIPKSDKYEILTAPDMLVASLTSLTAQGEETAPTGTEGPDAHADGFAAAPGMPHESTEPAAE